VILLRADGVVKTTGGRLEVYTAKEEDAASEFAVQKAGVRENTGDDGPWRSEERRQITLCCRVRRQGRMRQRGSLRRRGSLQALETRLRPRKRSRWCWYGMREILQSFIWANIRYFKLQCTIICQGLTSCSTLVLTCRYLFHTLGKSSW